MTAKKAFTIWLLIIFAFLTALGTLHGWIAWQMLSLRRVTIFSFAIDVIPYFISTLVTTFLIIGAICHAAFKDDSYALPLYKISKDFEEKLDAKGEEIKNSTTEALTKLGLQEFQLKESVGDMQQKFGVLKTKFEESSDHTEKALKTSKKKLATIERKLGKIETNQKDLPKLKRNLKAIEAVEKNLKKIQGVLENKDAIPKPYLSSSDDIKLLKDKVLTQSTIQRLKSNSINKVEDLLTRSPVELALTNAISETEAKNLQSVIQLLMIPGLQHKDAMLLLKSGVNSKQELALQDTFTLGSRVSKVADLYEEVGKIEEEDKPTFEKVASWIKLARES